MPLPDDRTRARRTKLAAAGLALAGFALTLLIFYPGIMTYDAKFVYEDIAKNALGDWQSPVMTVLWRVIDPVAPGTASMFLLIVSLYWVAFGSLALSLATRASPVSLLLPILALMPPAFFLVGIVWRDVLFSAVWLLAGSLAFAATQRPAPLRRALQTLALALCAFGFLLRPNALIAAPLLSAYVIWPDKFNWKRTAIAFVPSMIAFFVLLQLVYYGALDAKRQHPLQSIMVFDLGGITYFARENQFPVSWTATRLAMLLNDCYKPTEWDIYWTREPCQFVMQKLEKEEGLFGTPAITNAWLHAIARHPVAYLQHRAAFMWNFLAGANLTMWMIDIENPTKAPFADRASFAAVTSIHDVLEPTPLFRSGTWLLACFAVCALAWRQRDTAYGAYAIGVSGSAAVYVLTFFAVGVASDFRYAYWAVLAGLAGSAMIAAGAVRRQPARTAPS